MIRSFFADKPDGGEWLIGEDRYVSVDRLVDDPNARLAILKSHPDGCESEVVTDRTGSKVRVSVFSTGTLSVQGSASHQCLADC